MAAIAPLWHHHLHFKAGSHIRWSLFEIQYIHTYLRQMLSQLQMRRTGADHVKGARGRTDGRTDGRTVDRRTDRRMDGDSGPVTLASQESSNETSSLKFMAEPEELRGPNCPRYSRLLSAYKLTKKNPHYQLPFFYLD